MEASEMAFLVLEPHAPIKWLCAARTPLKSEREAQNGREEEVVAAYA